VLEGLGDLSAGKLIEAIGESKTQSFERVIFALGIPFIGATAARALASAFPDINKLMSATTDQLEEVDGIGKKMADSVVAYFQSDRHRLIIEKLHRAGVKLVQTAQGQSNVLEGKVFVLTGTLPGLSREAATDMIIRNGGSVSSSVGGKTSYVLAGEKAGSKLNKALEKGIPVISEAEFLRMLAY